MEPVKQQLDSTQKIIILVEFHGVVAINKEQNVNHCEEKEDYHGKNNPKEGFVWELQECNLWEVWAEADE